MKTNVLIIGGVEGDFNLEWLRPLNQSEATIFKPEMGLASYIEM